MDCFAAVDEVSCFALYSRVVRCQHGHTTNLNLSINDSVYTHCAKYSESYSENKAPEQLRMAAWLSLVWAVNVNKGQQLERKILSGILRGCIYAEWAKDASWKRGTSNSTGG